MVDEATGKNWCGPCDRAKPHISATVDKITNFPVLFGIVPEKS